VVRVTQSQLGAAFTLRATHLCPPLGKLAVAAFKYLPVRVRSRAVMAVYRDGRRMWCDVADHTQRKMLFNCFEPRETEAVSALIRPGDHVVDVGANVGWFTVIAGRLAGPTGHVDAFEAFPANVAILERNVWENGLQAQVRILPAAASDEPGHLTVGVQEGSDSGSVTAGPGASSDMVRVKAVTVDDEVANRGPIRLMKVDVEGFEERVLAGAPETLARCEAVLIELNRNALGRNGSSPEAIVAILEAEGFAKQETIHSRRMARTAQPNFVNLLATRVPRR
jgi:FkbM family methyltransferase